MNFALRLVVFALFPLLVANFILWWPISKLAACVALAMLVVAAWLDPGRDE